MNNALNPYMGTRGEAVKGGSSWWSKNHSPPEDLPYVVKYTATPLPPLLPKAAKCQIIGFMLLKKNNSTQGKKKPPKNWPPTGARNFYT